MVSDPDIDWVRPKPPGFWIRDILIQIFALTFSWVHLLALQGAGAPYVQEVNNLSLYLCTGVMTLPLITRRAYPLMSMVIGTLIFFVVGSTNLVAGMGLGFQACYFAIIYAAVAWAPDRKMLGAVTCLITLGVLLYIVGVWVITGSAYYVAAESLDSDTAGPLSPSTASLVVGLLMNAAYFGGAIAFGRVSYHRAYQQSVLEAQAEKLAKNAEQMAWDAVVKDRLRIARELHDSIGHHVSAIGIQASAARRALSRKPELAHQPLENIESSARLAVQEMRSVLGVLRVGEDSEQTQDGRGEPQLADIKQLAEKLGGSHLAVHLSRVEHMPGALDQLSRGVQLSFYRIAQEALNNTVKHSTAQNVWLTLRTGSCPSGWAEIEIVDDGVAGSPGESSGYGLRGLRERATALGGTCEAGPRTGTEGWSVRIIIPQKYSGENV